MVNPFQDYLDKRTDPFVKYLRKKDVLTRVDSQLTPAIKSYVKSSIRPSLTLQDVTSLVADQLSKLPPRVIEKVLEKETIVKEVSKKDDKKYAEEKNLEILKEEIKSLKEIIERLKSFAVFHGGSGVIGLPSLGGNGGKTLQIVNGQPSWQTVSAGGSSSDAYTPTNVVTTRTFDASNTSLATLANVLGSLIASLQGAGVVK